MSTPLELDSPYIQVPTDPKFTDVVVSQYNPQSNTGDTSKAVEVTIPAGS